jgi:hypothetical protein
MKITRALVITLLIMSTVFTAAAYSYDFSATGNPNDTPAGTPVTAEGSGIKVFYLDPNLNQRDIVNGNTVINIVTSEYSWWAPSAEAGWKATTRGIPVNMYVVFQNSGNAPYTLDVTWETNSSNAVGWKTETFLTTDSAPRASYGSGDDFTLLDNGYATLEIIITPADRGQGWTRGSITR